MRSYIFQDGGSARAPSLATPNPLREDAGIPSGLGVVEGTHRVLNRLFFKKNSFDGAAHHDPNTFFLLESSLQGAFTRNHRPLPPSTLQQDESPRGGAVSYERGAPENPESFRVEAVRERLHSHPPTPSMNPIHLVL